MVGLAELAASVRANPRHRRIPISGASIGDKARFMEEVDLATRLYISLVDALAESINENVPLNQRVDVGQFVALVQDAAGDLVGPLVRGDQ